MDRNYLKLKSCRPFSSSYLYIDVPEYLADNLFVENKVYIRYKDEFSREGSPYILIICQVRKADEERFIKALSKLPNKMLLMGYTDYAEFCQELIDGMEAGYRI